MKHQEISTIEEAVALLNVVEAKRVAQFKESLQIMAAMDDLAEAMALTLESIKENEYPYELTIEGEKALAAWRAIRKPGLTAKAPTPPPNVV